MHVFSEVSSIIAHGVCSQLNVDRIAASFKGEDLWSDAGGHVFELLPSQVHYFQPFTKWQAVHSNQANMLFQRPMKHFLPLWWSLSWCFFSSLIGRWDCPPRALDKAKSPALLPMGGMAGGCSPEGCGVRGTGRPCPWDKCWAWSCCCCEKLNTDIEFVPRKRAESS